MRSGIVSRIAILRTSFVVLLNSVLLTAHKAAGGRFRLAASLLDLAQGGGFGHSAHLFRHLAGSLELLKGVFLLSQP